jgi:hypothetical protein
MVKTAAGWVSRSPEDLWAGLGNSSKTEPVSGLNIKSMVMILAIILGILLLINGDSHTQGGIMIGAIAANVKEWLESIIKSTETRKVAEKTEFMSFNVTASEEEIESKEGTPYLKTIGVDIIRYHTCNCGFSTRGNLTHNYTCGCGKNMVGTTQKFPPMMLNVWAADRNISLSNFAVCNIEPRAKNWLAKNNQSLNTGDWMSFGKVHTAGGASTTWMFHKSIGKALTETFGDIGSLGGYGQLLTSALYRGIHRITDDGWKVIYVEHGFSADCDGASPVSESCAKAVGLKKGFQMRLLGKHKGKEIVAKGTHNIVPDGDKRLMGADLVIDVNQVKVGKGILTEGELLEFGILGISNIDGEGDHEGYMGWQPAQFFPNTKEMNRLLNLNMKIQVRKLTEELSIMWTDKDAYTKVMKRLAYKIHSDDDSELDEKTMLEDQQFLFKMLLSNLPKIATRAAQARITGHIFTLEVMKMAMGSGIMLETHMAKWCETINPDTMTFGIRYPFLTGASIVKCNPDGSTIKSEAQYAQLDHDGDTIAVFVIRTTLDRKIADLVIASMTDRSKPALDISPMWEMKADKRLITVTNIRTKLLEQLQCMDIAQPCNVLQAAVACGDAKVAEQAAMVCHESAQVLKKYPVLKGTEERIEGNQWWSTANFTVDEIEKYGLNPDDRSAVKAARIWMDAMNVARLWQKEMKTRLTKGMLKPNMLVTAITNDNPNRTIQSFDDATRVAKMHGYKNVGYLNLRWKRNLEIANEIWDRTEMANEYNVFTQMDAILGVYKSTMNSLTTNVHTTELSVIKGLRAAIVEKLQGDKYVNYLTEDLHPMTPSEYITIHEMLKTFAADMKTCWGKKGEELSDAQRKIAIKSIIESWKSKDKADWDKYTVSINACLRNSHTTEQIWQRLMIHALFTGGKLGQICLPKGITPMDVFGWNPVIETMIPDSDQKDRRLTPIEEKFHAQEEETRIIAVLEKEEGTTIEW